MRDLNQRAAAQLRAEMARQNVTQTELAERCGWPQQRLSRRLSGEVVLRLDELAAAAAALDVDPLALLSDQEGA